MNKKAVGPEQSRRVFVGLSGGVDSAVSAALLKKEGYNVVGVFIKTWHPDFLECNEEEERRDAMRVSAHLDIPFLTFDLEDVYKKEVADYMIAEYKAGRTPNPDVMCNKEVKFGAFLKKALAMGADYVATGHYAQVRRFSKNSPLALGGNKNELLHFYSGSQGEISDASLRAGDKGRSGLNFSLPVELLKGKDEAKDQSYFLWTLNKEQLSKIIFPVGHLEKKDVRKLAEKFKLPVAVKKDSQGICFLGAVDLKNFLKHYIKEKKGKVVNEKGETIGSHEGAHFYTLGERHGFSITVKSPEDKPYYIIGKDIKKNILIVSQNKIPHEKHSNILRNVRMFKTNWIFIPEEGKNYTSQIRYHGEFLSCKIKITGKDKAEVLFEKPVLIASGQSLVVYENEVCLGGGVIV